MVPRYHDAADHKVIINCFINFTAVKSGFGLSKYPLNGGESYYSIMSFTLGY